MSTLTQIETLLPLAQWMPRQASSIAGDVDRIYFILLLISGLLLLVLGGAITTFIIRYRRGSTADRSNDAFHGLVPEIVWTVVTLIIFLAIGIWGALLYLRMVKPPPGDVMEVYVVGRQWMWEIIHPGGRREHNQLHVPVGQTVKLTMTSEDVIHSFFVPDFRLKHDVVPGRYVTLYFQATEEGRFPLYCAEFCGTAHSIMTGEVIVMKPEAYANWADEGDTSEALVQKGRQLFTAYACAGCHSQQSEIHAPQLEQLFGRQVVLDQGATVIADEAYLHDSILQPNKHIVAGYQPLMPTYKGVIPLDEVFALVEYIKSLSHAQLPEVEAER